MRDRIQLRFGPSLSLLGTFVLPTINTMPCGTAARRCHRTAVRSGRAAWGTRRTVTPSLPLGVGSCRPVQPRNLATVHRSGYPKYPRAHSALNAPSGRRGRQAISSPVPVQDPPLSPEMHRADAKCIRRHRQPLRPVFPRTGDARRTSSWSRSERV